LLIYLYFNLSLSSFFHLFFDESCDFFPLYLWAKELDDLSFGIDEEFSEVPWNHLSRFCGWIVKTAIVSQINENRMSIFSIDFYLLHNRESSIEVVFDKGINFLRSSILLPKELVTRKSNYLKSTILPSFMCFDHFFIVF
jgi:hypothetical protein